MVVSNSTLGTAGELRVASELLLRGFRPRMALVDEGVDIQLESGVTIQVKSALKPRLQGLKPTYNFSFQSTYWDHGRKFNVQHMTAEFAICWCVPPDLFYVIPRDVLGLRTVVAINTEAAIPSRPGRYAPYKNAWEALR